MPDFLTRKVAGKVPVWVLVILAIGLGLYLRFRSARNPKATTEEDQSVPDFTDTTGSAFNASPPPAPSPTVIVIDATGTAVSPAPGPGPGDAPAPGQTAVAPPPAEAPPEVGGGMPDIPAAAHDAPPPPPVYRPADQPNGYVPSTENHPIGDPGVFWAPAPAAVDPASGAIARDRNVEGL